MGEVNPDRLRELAGHLRHACRQLEEIGRQDVRAFLADAKSVNSAKYLAIVATEAALDICNHVAAKKGGRSPEDYADCMTILGELAFWSRICECASAEWPASASSLCISTGGSMIGKSGESSENIWRISTRICSRSGAI